MAIDFKLYGPLITVSDIQKKTSITVKNVEQDTCLEIDNYTAYLDIRESDGVVIHIMFSTSDAVTPILLELHKKLGIQFIHGWAYQGVAHGIEKLEDALLRYMNSFYEAVGLNGL